MAEAAEMKIGLPITLVAAVARNGAIGRNNQLPWHLPEDLAHFKNLTMGGIILMGRRTFESFPHGALPGRTNVVLTRSTKSLPGAVVCTSLDEALEYCLHLQKQKGHALEGPPAREVFIIGGESIYRQTIHLATRLCLTLVEQNPVGADAFFPKVDWSEWVETKKEKHEGFSFVEWRPKTIVFSSTSSL